jgi:hypothetical protein
MKTKRATCKKCTPNHPVGRIIKIPHGKELKDVPCPNCGKKGFKEIIINKQ